MDRFLLVVHQNALHFELRGDARDPGSKPRLARGRLDAALLLKTRQSARPRFHERTLDKLLRRHLSWGSACIVCCAARRSLRGSRSRTGRRASGQSCHWIFNNRNSARAHPYGALLLSGSWLAAWSLRAGRSCSRHARGETSLLRLGLCLCLCAFDHIPLRIEKRNHVVIRRHCASWRAFRRLARTAFSSSQKLRVRCRLIPGAAPSERHVFRNGLLGRVLRASLVRIGFPSRFRLFNQRIFELARRVNVNQTPFVLTGHRVFVPVAQIASVLIAFKILDPRRVAVVLAHVEFDGAPVLLTPLHECCFAIPLCLEGNARQLHVECNCHNRSHRENQQQREASLALSARVARPACSRSPREDQLSLAALDQLPLSG